MRFLSFRSGSKLTQLLKDEIGGNCKTRVLMCIKPNTDGRVLSVLFKYSEHISRIKNFPIRNDSFSQVSVRVLARPPANKKPHLLIHSENSSSNMNYISF